MRTALAAGPAEEAFTEQLRRVGGATEPGFLRALRAAGRDTFLAVRLPGPRHDSWRATSLAPLAAVPFAAAGASGSGVDPDALPSAPRLVVVNGRVDRAASDLSGLPRGVRVGSLAQALRERPGELEQHLGRAAPSEGAAFAALNAALFEDGALVELDPGVTCELPIQLVFVSGGGRPAASWPRSLVLAGAGARATVLESYRGQGAYLVAPVTELVLDEGAHVEHDRLQEDAPEAFHVAHLQVRQAPGSRLDGRSVALGGRLARVDMLALLDGEGAACDLAGLSVGGGQQVLDHLVLVDHARPRCTSTQSFKGILDGASRGVFAGRILVRPGAQGTDAGQRASNLLLSDDAVADARPQLEILADDVKCSHGGTVGALRPEALFYLRTRGVPAAMARALLTWAFAAELVERIGPAALRARVRQAVTARLPHGELLREAA